MAGRVKFEVLEATATDDTAFRIYDVDLAALKNP